MPVSSITHAVVAGVVAGSVASQHATGDSTFLRFLCMIVGMFSFYIGCTGAYNAFEERGDDKIAFTLISLFAFSLFLLMVYFICE